jgi:hypothetical protein
LDFMGLFTGNMMGISWDLARLNGRFCCDFIEISWGLMGFREVGAGIENERWEDHRIMGSGSNCRCGFTYHLVMTNIAMV